MTKTALLEDSRLIRLVCASMLGMQVAVVLLVLSLAYPFMSTMNEISRQFPQIIESIKKNKNGNSDSNWVALEKEMQAIKVSLEEIRRSMDKMELMPITMAHMNETLIDAKKDILGLADNMMTLRRKTETYLTTTPLMENSIINLDKELSTISFDLKKLHTKLPNTHDPLNCLFTPFDGRSLPFKGYTYQGETFILPSKDPMKDSTK